MATAVQLLKWLSQVLIVVGGVWALVSDTHERDLATGRRRLTQSGWMKLFILAVGFGLFVLTDVQNRAQQQEAIRIRDQEIKRQNAQLSYLRKLFLLQHELSAVEVSWSLSERDLGDFSQVLLGYGEQVQAGPELKTNLQYINTAVRNSMRSGNNWLNVRQIGRGRFGLQVLISRPLGMKLTQFSNEQHEWKAFDAAIQRLLGDRFEIEVAPGVVIADLAKKHWPCEFSIVGSTVHFTVERPGVSLGQLEGARVTYWGGNLERARMPKRLRLRFKDPKVTLDQQFDLEWEEVVLFSARNEDDGYELKYSNLKAGPFQLPVSILYDLLLPINQSP
jgi:hypothetical protein